MSDLIAAVATGWVRSGIGIVRMSGSGCIAAASGVFRTQNGKPLSEAPDRHMTLGTLLDEQGRVLDHCVAVISHGPHSYTGEDTCEFQCHGSPCSRPRCARCFPPASGRQAPASSRAAPF